MSIQKVAGVDCTLQSSTRNHVPEKPPKILGREADQAELIAELGECAAHNELGLVGRAYFVRSVREWSWVYGPCPTCSSRAPKPRPSGLAELVADGRWQRTRSRTWKVPLASADARSLKVGSMVRFKDHECRIERLATEDGSTVATVKRLE